MAFKLESPAFTEGSTIPKRYTGEGANLSPALTWTEIPAGTKELALVCEDPDAPQKEPFVHWVAYKIPAHCAGLPENAANADGSVRQGRNSWNEVGYGGPMPPKGHGIHHYNFKLFALDEPLELPEGASKKELLAAIAQHQLGAATLVGIYAR